ncbi:MAG: hypothetical protein NVS3B18_03730 [Candidatus Dormibacteria bacterium]
MRTHIRKNVSQPASLDAEVRARARERGTSQSGLITHLLRLGLASEDATGDPLLRCLGSLDGPTDLSETVDATVYLR